MGKRQWYYRGSLKSCNYSCSYCPFAKRTGTKKSIQKDQQAFFRFIAQMIQQQNGGALLVVPYGEALIHPYYWEGLAALSKSPAMDAVGAQSNFSFSAKKMLAVYRTHGGVLEKLRLWGTFHPEMVTAERFARQCRFLTEQGVSYCAGAVGVPEHLEQIRALRETLLDSVYLWINKMDGLKRRYTDGEIAAFTEIDPYFRQELKHYRADYAACGDSRFVEADGTIRRCNISRQKIGNFYEESGRNEREGRLDCEGLESRPDPGYCSRKECSCYLAYCSREDAVNPFFRPYPAFRIPVYPKAVFFDIDGTLVPKGEKQIPKETADGLARLARRCEIYLATSLPLEIAQRKIAPVGHLIRGGVFANGARWQVKNYGDGCLDDCSSGRHASHGQVKSYRDGCLDDCSSGRHASHGQVKSYRDGCLDDCSSGRHASLGQVKSHRGGCLDAVVPMDAEWLADVKGMQRALGFAVHVYRKRTDIYKVTLAFRKLGQGMEMPEHKRKELAQELKIPDSCQALWEENCMQITKRGTGKLAGILEICRVMGYRREDVMAFGDSFNDREMVEYFS